MSSNVVPQPDATLDGAFADLLTKPNDDPRDAYSVLREAAPVFRTSMDCWFVSTYDLVDQLSRDAARFRNQPPAGSPYRTNRDKRAYHVFRNMMLFLDGMEHRHVRGLVARVFTPRAIGNLRGHIGDVIRNAFDAQAGCEQIDLLHDLSLHIPARVILSMLGIDLVHAPSFVAFADHLIFLTDAAATPEEISVAEEIVEETADLVETLIEQRRGHPGDDLLSRLVNVEDGGERMTNEEILSTVLLLVVAGHETTGNTFVNGIYNLLQRPEQFAALRADPNLIPRAAEEFLRFEGAARNLNPRWANEDAELGDVIIPAGDLVYGCIQAANSDPVAFQRANEFDITRTPSRSIAFGFGPHRCIGATLASQELELMTEHLIHRTTRIELTSPVDWRRSFTIRGLTGMPISWDLR